MVVYVPLVLIGVMIVDVVPTDGLVAIVIVANVFPIALLTTNVDSIGDCGSRDFNFDINFHHDSMVQPLAREGRNWNQNLSYEWRISKGLDCIENIKHHNDKEISQRVH